MQHSYLQELRTHINALDAMGNALLPVVLKEDDLRFGNGKAPSSIKPNGNVSLISGRTGWSIQALEEQIVFAKKYGHSLGIAIQPPQDLVIIDLDVQNYPGGKTELMQDYDCMV